jgi:hypothetical protein
VETREERKDVKQQQPASVPTLNKRGIRLTLLTRHLDRLKAVSQVDVLQNKSMRTTLFKLHKKKLREIATLGKGEASGMVKKQMSLNNTSHTDSGSRSSGPR